MDTEIFLGETVMRFLEPALPTPLQPHELGNSEASGCDGAERNVSVGL